MELEWIGEGVNEVGRDKKTGRILVRISERYFRPTEVDLLHGDPSKAKLELGWEPRISFEATIREMIQRDCGEGSF
jgi:GDPmannose 4,6-dehydratase